MAGAAGLSTALLLTGCAAIGSIPPFSLDGPWFIVVFLAIWAITLRAALRRSWADGEPALASRPLEVYEVAYLSGGPRGTVGAAVASLLQRNAVSFDPTNDCLSVTAPLGAGAPALEHAVHRRIGAHAVRAGFLAEQSAKFTVSIREQLERRGLWLPEEEKLPLLLSAVAPLLGVIKVGVGIWREKPVGFLLLLCVAGAAVSYLAFRPGPRASRRGKMELARLRSEHSRLRSVLEDLAPPGALPLSVGLFGVSALGASELGVISPFFRKQERRSADGGWDPVSADGSGSDSASGDGGGGGDGGCGGCGGCGGD
jgi:uncharacterized protein (TIGR04222 family)